MNDLPDPSNRDVATNAANSPKLDETPLSDTVSPQTETTGPHEKPARILPELNTTGPHDHN